MVDLIVRASEIDAVVESVSDTAEGTVLVADADARVKSSNITQDPTGEVRVSKKILLEDGAETVGNSYELGDALTMSGSGPQQVNTSRITDIKYQIPYQEFDKTGSQATFEVHMDTETHVVRQPIFDTVLTSGDGFDVPGTVNNEILNTLYIRTNGDISNFRYKMTSVATGKVIESYPDKFAFEKGIGKSFTGAGVHAVDLYFAGHSTPTRYLAGTPLHIIAEWGGPGNLVGKSTGEPYYEFDLQYFTLDPLAKVSDLPTPAEIKTDYESNANTNAFTDAEKLKLDDIQDCGRYLGVFADLTTLQTAYPTGKIGDTATVTSPNGNMFYWNVTVWSDSGTGYVGDMLESVYDPTSVHGDAFSMDSMVEGANTKILTPTERTTIGSQSGTNTGDQDLSGLAAKNNVLELDNTTAFTPDADYEPSTKKYVDDNAGTAVNYMAHNAVSHIDGLDVSPLSPFGVLYITQSADKELKSLSGGSNGDVIHLIHDSTKRLKVKHDNGSSQKIKTPNCVDANISDCGGCTLVYNSTSGYWHVVAIAL